MLSSPLLTRSKDVVKDGAPSAFTIFESELAHRHSSQAVRIETWGTLFFLVWRYLAGISLLMTPTPATWPNLPIGDRVRLTAITRCFLKRQPEHCGDATGLEGVELGRALVATPDVADRRCSPATGAREISGGAEFFKFAQAAGGF